MFNFEKFKFEVTCTIESVCRRIANLLTRGDYFQLIDDCGGLLADYMTEKSDNYWNLTRNAELLREIAKLRTENDQLYTRIDSLINAVDEMGDVLDKTLAERDHIRDEVLDLQLNIELGMYNY